MLYLCIQLLTLRYTIIQVRDVRWWQCEHICKGPQLWNAPCDPDPLEKSITMQNFFLQLVSIQPRQQRTFHFKRNSSKCSMQPYVTLVFQVYHLSRSDTRIATSAASGKVLGHLPHSHARTTRSRYTDQYQEERQLLDVLSQCFIWPCI